MSLAATLSLAAASGKIWDAIVVGAGPAGALAARELARQGVSVLLVERTQFPRFKVCGGCLNPRALRLLHEAGLGDLTAKLGAVPVARFRLGAGRRFAELRLATGAALSREVFDAALVEAASASGVSFLPGTTASLIPPDQADRRVVRLRQGSEHHDVEARVVLGAVGLGGHLEWPPGTRSGSRQTSDAALERKPGDFRYANQHDARADPQAWKPGSRVGAGVIVPTVPAGYQPHVVYMACAEEGYVGQVIVEGGRLDVAAALDPLAAKAAGGTGALAAAIIDRAGFPPIPDLADLPWKGTPHLTRQSPRVGAECLFLLGDAAGYIEPFTGEGMAWALAGATTVTPLALQAIRVGWSPDLLTRWRLAYRRSVTNRQLVCRLTAAMLRRPLATRVLVRGLGALPWLARPFLAFMYRK